MAKTPAEKLRSLEPWPHEYGYHLGQSMLILCIGLCFAVVAPPLLPLALSYFCSRHCVDKYNLLYGESAGVAVCRVAPLKSLKLIFGVVLRVVCSASEPGEQLPEEQLHLWIDS